MNINIPPSFRFRDLAILVTHRCVNKCRHCSFGTKSNDIDELTTDEVFCVLTEAREMGFERINFTGGEPFVRADIFELLDKAVKLGFRVSVNTSAALFTESSLKQLLESGVNTIILSLDGDKAYHDQFRGRPGLYLKVLRSAEYLAKTKKVIFSFVLNSENLCCLPSVVVAAKNTGVSLSVMPYNNTLFYSDGQRNLSLNNPAIIEEAVQTLLEIKRGEHGDILSLSEEHILRMQRYLLQPDQRRGPCYAGYLRPQVDANGFVRLCFSLPPVANIRNVPLKESLTGDRFQEMQRKMGDGLCPGCMVTCFEKRNIQLLENRLGN